MTPKQKMVIGILAVVVVAILIGVLAFAGRSSKTEPTTNGAPTGSAPTGGGAPTGGSPPASKVPAPANSPAVPVQTTPTRPEYLMGKKHTDLQSAYACPAGYAVIDDQAECDKAAVTLIETTHKLPAGHPLLAAPNTVSSRLDNVKHLQRYASVKDMKECGRSGCGAHEHPKGCALREHGTGLTQVGFNSHEGETGDIMYDRSWIDRGGWTTTPYCKRV